MKYFSPSYWFKLWALSAPLFNDKTQGINAKSIENKKIKDWASKDITSLKSINEQISFTNSTTNYQPYSLNKTNQNINPIYQTELETSTHKHRHKKSRNRDKRQPNPNRRAIFQLTEQLTIDSNNRQQYRNSFQSVLHSLVNNNILRVVFDNTENTNWGEINRIFTLNTQNYGYFRLPIVIRWQQNEQSLQRNFELVLRTDNLYIQGFIVTERGSHTGEISTYYHFNFDNINPNMQPRAVQDGTVPHLINIDGIQNRQLTGISPDYRDMIPTQNNNINWNSIVNSFIVLTNDINVSEEHSLGNLARSLGQVVFMTAEAIRFPDIYARIVTHLVNRDENLEFNRRSEIYRILVSWSERSRNNRLQQRLIEAVNNINNPDWNGFTMLDLTRELNSPSVQVLLGYINFRLRNNGGDVNCRRGKREIKNTYWHEKFCDLKPKSDKIKGKITSIKILDEKTQGGNLKAGTIYVGTENGVYLTYSEGEVHKFDGLNFPITSIKLDNSGSAYITNNQEEVYHLNLVGWGSEKLNNFKSSNLESELKLYYKSNKKDEIINFQPSNSVIRKGVIYNLNLGRINPIDNYKKLEFLGDTNNNRLKWGSSQSNCWDFTSDYKINYCYYQTVTGKNLKRYLQDRKNEFRDIIKEGKISTDTSSNEICRQYSPEILDYIDESYDSARVFGSHSFGLNSYYEWNRDHINYYIQAAFCVYADWRASSSSLESWFFIGNGIRLYNDDTFETNDRKKREIFDINNLKEKNITKWTDEFTNSINNEQHLSIHNKTNFVSSNITSL